MQDKKALILLNMWSSENRSELKLFLKNMFYDENIILIKNKIVRKIFSLILSNIIIRKSWKNYELIWWSPLKKITEKLCKKLEKEFGFSVFYIMRYTQPFSNEIIEKFKKEKIKDIILLPLYPQYSTTTTLSSFQDFYNSLLPWEREVGRFWSFKITEIKPFYKNRFYNELIVEKIIKKVWKKSSDFNLIFSAHSLPEKIILSWDPYKSHLEEQIEIIKNIFKEKDIEFKSISLAYQSKVWKSKWLEPNINDRIKSFSKENIIIYPISFIIDNSETKFELDIFYRKKAKEYWVWKYELVECFNDSREWVELIKNLIKSN